MRVNYIQGGILQQINLISMNRLISQQVSDNIDIHDSNPMDHNQQAMFLRLNHSKSNDSFLGRLLPQHNQVPQRSLIFDFIPPSFINNVVLNTHKPPVQLQPPRQEKTAAALSGGLHIFKKIKKEKVRSKCDYDKNICGYITKKVIRQFVSPHYEREVNELVRKYHSNYEQCKLFYLKKVEFVTGPSHLPELFDSSPDETEHITSYKKVFKRFYRWFLKQRYLRYLLVEGKMADKHAYMEYKNSHLFRYVQESDGEGQEMQYHVLTRSKSVLKLEGDGL